MDDVQKLAAQLATIQLLARKLVDEVDALGHPFAHKLAAANDAMRVALGDESKLGKSQ